MSGPAKTVLSIQRKLSGVIFALTVSVTAFFCVYFPARQIAATRSMLDEKASTYARLVSQEVESAIAFDDKETVREVFQAVAQDRDVHALALLRSNGTILYVVGEPGGPDVIRTVVPVVSKEGPTGTLVLEVATHALDAERARVRRRAAEVGAVALLAGLLAAWAIGRSLARRVGAIASSARAVAGGDLGVPEVVDRSADEVGQLARDFNAMTANLRSLVRTMAHDAEREQERLEQLVAARTAELSERNEAMRRVLDHVGQGLAGVGRDGSLGDERSRTFTEWFGTPPPGTKLWEAADAIDPLFAETLRVSWDMLDDPDLPLDVVLDAFPTMLRCNGRFLRFEYRPIEEDGTLVRMLVVGTDVTSDVERRRADEAQRELVLLAERVLTDPTGCLELVTETDRLLDVVVSAKTASPAFLRALHTMKGNSLLYGQQTLADLCHTTESIVRDTGLLPAATEIAALSEQWRATKAKIAPLLDGARASRIEIGDADYEALRSAIPFAPRPELARMVARWRLEPVAKRFQRLSQQATALAARLGKKGVRVITDAGDVRLDAETWAPFWSSFVHVVRNAIDHGIESPRERAERGKLNDGIVVLRAFGADDQLVVEISDDGRGIDWDALEARARELGMYTRERATLEDLLFRDGVSTREVADETSGRGIGLGAVRAAALALGGRVHVESKAGSGTLVRFVFPVASVDSSYRRAPLARAA